MATPPTIKSTAQVSSWTTSSTSKTISVTVASGDYLCVIGLIEIASGGTGQLSCSSSGVDAWVGGTEYGPSSSTSYARSFTARATTTGTITITLSKLGGANQMGGFCWVIDPATTTGVDSSAGKASTSSVAMDWSHTTVANNCLILAGVSDWDAGAVATTWTTINGFKPAAGNGVDLTGTSSTHYTWYLGHWPDAGAAATNTVGLTTSHVFTGASVAFAPAASNNGSVTAVAASATANATVIPVALGGAKVTNITAVTAAAQAPAASIQGGATITTIKALAQATKLTSTTGIGGAAVTTPVADAQAAALAAQTTGSAALAASWAAATSDALAPVLTSGAMVQALSALSTAEMPNPTVTGSSTGGVSATNARSTATAWAPTVTSSVSLSAVAATATATAYPVDLSSVRIVLAPAATAAAAGVAPAILGLGVLRDITITGVGEPFLDRTATTPRGYVAEGTESTIEQLTVVIPYTITDYVEPGSNTSTTPTTAAAYDVGTLAVSWTGTSPVLEE